MPVPKQEMERADKQEEKAKSKWIEAYNEEVNTLMDEYTAEGKDAYSDENRKKIHEEAERVAKSKHGEKPKGGRHRKSRKTRKTRRRQSKRTGTRKSHS